MPRPHRSESQTREAVGMAVIDHVAQYGIPANPSFPMEQIITAAGISRASAYRIWPGREAFVAFALEQCAAGRAVATLDSALLRRLTDKALAIKGDAVARAAHFLAASGDEEVTLLLSSPQWRAFVAFRAIAAATDSDDVRDAVAQADDEDLARLTRTYARIAEAWSLEPVDGTDGIASLAYAAMIQLRTTVAAIVGGSNEAVARRRLRSTLQALVRGTFRAKPGTRVSARDVRRAIASTID
ncbi:hypothetical protein EK0264_04420 [Epidermidibacterium keratini]|uniref:HTH tetR-type domain-containing protein n=1 Tax=Epidermidibacterium keratini TaxID=1891644 RepID=A0A7L4YL47_9ACTN|nr:hypothetical protein [Epidermidibacterium keratini]QHB99602.1 hypothetical protein EK0264_04420 [Epidermidibacterium keratini]